MEVKNKEILNAPMTIVAMVNGMIGGLILLLPVFALNAGYLLTLIVILFTGIFSYYSCYLCLLHLGDQPDLDYTILRHFNGQRWVKIFYDLCVWLCLILVDMLYFQLILIQWQGLVPPHQFSPINPIVNAFVLLTLVFVLKYFQFGASILSYGIISIISYLIFLVWVIATYDQGNDSVQYKPFGVGGVDLAAAMGAAFSIQVFFIPVLKKNPNPKKYTFYTMLAYIFGMVAYYYIAYVGSVGIWKRNYVEYKGSQKTIEGYFQSNSWQVNIIEAIYLVHLYSVFPQFMIISKKRMFGVIRLKQSDRGHIKISEIVYFLLMLGICFLIGFFRININDIIDINGGVIGFFFIYFIPAALHVKCLYFSKGKRPIPSPQILLAEMAKNTPAQESALRRRSQTENMEAGLKVSMEVPQLKQSQTNKEVLLDNQYQIYQMKNRAENKQNSEAGNVDGQQPPLQKEQAQLGNRNKAFEINQPLAVQKLGDGGQVVAEKASENDFFYCNCDLSNYSRKALALDWVFIIVMVGIGVFIMVNSIATVVSA